MSATWPLVRGQVIQANIGLDEPKLFVVVSNNQRNRHLGQVLAVRLTTSNKPPIASIVELGHPEVFAGRAVCDDIIEVYADEVLSVRGALTDSAMTRISAGLRAALAL